MAISDICPSTARASDDKNADRGFCGHAKTEFGTKPAGSYASSLNLYLLRFGLPTGGPTYVAR